MNPLAWVTLIPLAGALSIGLLNRAPAVLALLSVAAGLAASVWLLVAVAAGAAPELTLPGLPAMPLRLGGEPLQALLSLVVAGVAFFVVLYAVGYSRDDPQRSRFFSILCFFIAAMQALVLAADWLLLLAAWELIGLSSYLLIGFWYQRPGVAAAANRAFLYTRSADMGLYLAAFALILASGSSEIATSLQHAGAAAPFVGLMLLLAAMGKSAQTPLHDWLQRAMAGPTPVSALLHSATLVAAGAILLIRSAPLLPDEILLLVALVGGVTTVVTGLIALAETDLKRLLAASTSSQYGLMLIAVGAGAPVAALLHLIAHAAIKSALFLAAGVFQHSRESTEFKALRGVGRERKATYGGFALAALALAGIPPLSGYFSKDAVIAATLVSPHPGLLGGLALAGTLLTGAYMARALRLLWRGEARPHRLAGLVWMGSGLAGLVLFAATLKLYFSAIESLLESVPPESTLASVMGLGAALSGLLLGGWLGGKRLSGPLWRWARQGFAISGGMTHWVVHPALGLARRCQRLEDLLYATVLAIGRMGLLVGRVTRCGDEGVIDRLILALAHASRTLGVRLRGLHSGLVHRELALTTAAGALMLGVLAALGWWVGPGAAP